MNFKLY